MRKQDHIHILVYPSKISLSDNSLVDCVMCEGKGQLDDVFLPSSDLEDYKINREYYTPIDALDIKKTRESWIALVYCDSVKGYGKSFRLYMWRIRKGEKIWKLSLCNFPADNNIAMPINIQRMLKFIRKYRSDE